MRDDQQVVFGAGLLPAAANPDLAAEPAVFKVPDFQFRETQRLIELEHGRRRFENDRLAESLLVIRRRPFVAIDDQAGPDLDAVVRPIVVVILKDQPGLAALKNLRIGQSPSGPSAGRKQRLKLLDLNVVCVDELISILLGDRSARGNVGRWVDPPHDEQRVHPVGNHDDRKTAGDASQSIHQCATELRMSFFALYRYP